MVFGVTGSNETFRVVLKFDQSNQEKINQYEFTLKQFLKQLKHNKPQQAQQVPLHPPPQVNRPPIIGQPIGSYPPRKLLNDPNQFENPFGQEEYVGRNHPIFKPQH